MKLCISFLLLSAAFAVSAQPLPDYTFKSPAFNGNGYSAHILTIENQEHNRREAIQKEIQAKLEKEANDAKNTNISKFMNNLESPFCVRVIVFSPTLSSSEISPSFSRR